jgi:hypothetical protein
MEPLSETLTFPNLRSPECLARGLPQGGKPTTKSVLRRTVGRRAHEGSHRPDCSRHLAPLLEKPCAARAPFNRGGEGWSNDPWGRRESFDAELRQAPAPAENLTPPSQAEIYVDEAAGLLLKVAEMEIPRGH